MDSHLLPTFVFFLFAIAAVHGDLTIEAYWKKMLGNTAMPNAIKENIVAEGKEKASLQNIIHYFLHDFSGRTIGAKESELLDDTVRSMFLLEKDLSVGKTLYLHLPKKNAGTFLPRHVSESIPFLSTELAQILNRFSMKPDSPDAKLVKETLEKCEVEDPPEEKHYCATSLESMVDFVTSELGKNVKAFSSTTPKETAMKYTILGVTKLGTDNSAIACHKTSYLYTVFYCHEQPATTRSMVSMVGADGTKAEVLVTCHSETADWHPKFIAFQVLKIKPGATVCHFLSEHDVLWVRA